MTKKNLLTTAMLLLGIVSAKAERDTTVSQNLAGVEVIGVYNSMASEKLRVVYSISKEQISALPVQDINELLDYLPGIDVRQRGANGVQADLSMRGGTFDQVMIMLNGVNLTDIQTGHYSLDLPILLSQIDRIEVLQGASVSLFGLSAFSGAINIITGQSADNHSKMSLTMGENSLFLPTAKLNVGYKKWLFSGAASHSSSDGYMQNSDYKNNNIFLQANFRDKKTGKLNVQLGLQTKDYGANTFYSANYPNQFDATKTLIASVQAEKNFGNFKIDLSAFYRRHHDRFELFRDSKNLDGTPAAAWYKGHNYHLTDVTGGNIKGAYYSKIGHSAVGVEVRNEHIFSNVLGDKLDNPKKIPLEQTDTNFIYGKNRLNINYFAEQEFIFAKFSASLGVSGNYNTMFGNNFAFGANLGYEFKQGLLIYANINRALRLPTFTDLYYKSATQQSNPDLKPEHSLTAEIGLKVNHKGFYAGLTAFYRSGRGIIDWIRFSSDSTVWHSMNYTKINTLGGELSIGYQWNKWIKTVDLSYSYINSDKKMDGFLSLYALDYLKHKITAKLEHKIYKNFGATWQYTFQVRNNSNSALTDYKPFGLFDGRIYWQNAHLNVFLDANNILDTKYHDIGGIEQPGRWVKCGVGYLF